MPRNPRPLVWLSALTLAAAQPAVDRGEELLKQGDLDGAWRAVIASAQAGNGHAQFIAGMIEANRGRTQAARAWWLKCTSAGYAEGFTALGYFALGGRGGEPRSAANAAALFGQGARRGSAQGMLNLARLLMIGEGVRRDRARAGELRAQAAALKEPTALALVRAGGNKDGAAIVDVSTWLGNFDRAAEGVELLAAEGRAGNTTAMVVLGKIYYNGQAGGGRDYALARQWWEKAGNNPAALYYLGVLGVHTDWGRAETHFIAAAKQGHPDGPRMAATVRDVRVPPPGEGAGRDFANFCSTRGGAAVGVSCMKHGDTIFVE